jgi:hypothetical protein
MKGIVLMKYKILLAHTPVELADIVNEHITRKWRPLGGIAIGETGPDGTSYVQAMKISGKDEEAEAEWFAKNNSNPTA